MCKLLKLLGKLLFIILFIGAGVNKVTQPTESVAYLKAEYPKFYNLVTETYRLPQLLPE